VDKNSSHTPFQPIPLHPLIDNIDGTGMKFEEWVNSSDGLIKFVNSFVDKFVALLPTANFGDSNGIVELIVPLSSGGAFPMMVKRR
jgi:hypothetical protein